MAVYYRVDCESENHWQSVSIARNCSDAGNYARERCDATGKAHRVVVVTEQVQTVHYPDAPAPTPTPVPATSTVEGCGGYGGNRRELL